MSQSSDTVALSGSAPGQYPHSNIFDFVFGNPFSQQSDTVPASQKLARIEDSRPIFVDNNNDRTLTFGKVREDALKVAANLRDLGLDPDQIHSLPKTPTCARPELAPVVLIQLPNCLAFASILFGTFASGLTASLASPALTATELSWILQNARPRAIITAKACLGAMHEALKSQKDTAFFAKVPVFTVDVANDSYLTPTPAARPASSTSPLEQDWSALLKIPLSPARSYQLSAETAPNRTAVILWSSGTSGRSKGVLISHNALVFATASIWYDADWHRPGLQQSWLGYVPFYHVFGLCNIFLLAPCIGATCHVMSAFNLEAMLAGVARRKVTYLHMAPPVAVMLAKAAIVDKYARGGGFSTIVAGVTGGAPLGHEVVVEVHKRLGFRVKMGYGLSETCNTSLQRGTSEADMHAGAGDSGRPHYGVELLIAADGQDFKGGATKPGKLGAPGEILIRSPGVMSAYLPIGGLGDARHAPDMAITADALTPDGWFRTGDVGFLDERGAIHITDRLKELIKVRAYQVAPAELEAVLCSSEAVADAGVIGIYDNSQATEWPRAYVVPRNAELIQKGDRKGLEKLAQELKALVEKRTAKYKWLIGGIVFTDAIPKSPSGKILRRVIKDGGVKGGIEVVVYEKKKRDSKL
ncbi:cetylsynthetase-like protein [Diaporthe amygdali]|uniref:cetylsynthetase-like protein n=1 Tax=Phomopsis amygdali TaxID=1214568 RepID=UPI0022FEB9D9|nr:cetylsynthetase-like protein [Diaporthe amygdali]KAJ0106816.1 cetylsynthetase-like protein [Diaporthe amygdali]